MSVDDLVVVDDLVGLECPPLYYRVPPRAATYGPEIGDFGASAGLDLDPEQQLVVDAVYAVDEDDRLASPVIGCAGPRQNVKTHVLKVCGLGDLAVFRIPEMVWTAQQKDTALDSFRNKWGTGLADLFDNYDHLRRLVYRINDSDNDTSITLLPKRAGDPYPSLTFATRTDRGKVGFSGPRLTFDESPWLKAVHTAAMVPILSAQSMSVYGAQLRFFGSMGHLHSATWRGIRDRGRRGEIAWIEWGAPRVKCADPECRHEVGAEGCALDREDLVRAANLAIGRRIDLKFVMVTERAELSNPDPMKFARERLGWWEDPADGASGAVELVVWRARATRSEDMTAPVLAVEVAKDRSASTIGAAWMVDGRPHLEVVDERAGTGWLVARCVELAERYMPGARMTVVLDPSTEAKSLIKPLEDAGLVVVRVTPEERAAACGRWFDLVVGDEDRPGDLLTHNGDPAFESAIESAIWRDVGDDARVLSRKYSAGDIRALYVGVLSLHGLELGAQFVLNGSLST